MAQWRDEENADAGTIEELAPVAQPARVGGNRSARIPALLVGAILIGVVAVGVSGRTAQPPIQVPPVAAVDASPTPRRPDSPAPVAPQGHEPSSPPSTAPATTQPFPVEVFSELRPFDDGLRLWLVILSDGRRLLRTELEPIHPFYQPLPSLDARGDDVRVRLVARLGSNRAVRVAEVTVPRVPDRSVDLPLELASGLINADPLGARDPHRRLYDLHYALRLEGGRGRGLPAQLVAEISVMGTVSDDASAPHTTPSAPHTTRDRALASGAAREALRGAPRCARVLDPRTGRSEAALESCAPVLRRAGLLGPLYGAVQDP
jgi:hypothetical protein